MTDYVLVHGGYVAGWAWERVAPYLKADKRVGEVITPDLVGHGLRLDNKPKDRITLDDYVRDVVDTIEKRDLHDVVLTGHSLSGVFLPQAAARIPSRIKRLVFISGMLPLGGKSATKTVQEDLGINFGNADSKNQNDYRKIFCHYMDEATIEWYLEKLGPEPPAALNTPVSHIILPAGIPVTYIKLTEDRWLTLPMQNQMVKTLKKPELIELKSGHNAPITHPEEIARILLRYA